MIVSEKIYNIRCDNCGCILDEECYHTDPNTVEEVLLESGWTEVEGKHYCPDCCHWDDDGEQEFLVIDETRKSKKDFHNDLF